MLPKTWDDFAFWRSDDWLKAQLKLDFELEQGYTINPDRENIFAALDATPLEEVKVALIGQDPYPLHRYATGLAFSIPPEVQDCPPTLVNLLTEWWEDLHLDPPNTGNLRPWTEQGVLLWNAVPSCRNGQSLSHYWFEWKSLTNEIVSNLSKKGVPIILLGRVAREHASLVDPFLLIEASHPSPRGAYSGYEPFMGSRVFSRANAIREQQRMEAVDWRLRWTQ